MSLLMLRKTGLLVAMLLSTSACFPAIEALCEDAAIAECNRCYACALDDGPSGGQLCDVEADPEKPIDEDRCIETMTDRCAAQASTLDKPKSYINTCIDSQEGDTCEDKLGRHALNQTSATYQCAYLF